MRLPAYLLLVGSLIGGSLAATTAYAPRIEAVVASGELLTLAAPAGRDPAQPDAPAVTPGDADQPLLLTPDVTARLTALNVERVRVKEFALGRWDHSWIFGLSLAGLVLGGVLIRREAHRELAARVSRPTHHAATPQALLEAAHAEVEALLRDAAALPPDAQPAEIIRRVEAIQAAHLAPFAEARPELIGRYGVAGFARLMDSFAAAERLLNRAWSAAADGAAGESIASLESAASALSTARARIAALAERPTRSG